MRIVIETDDRAGAAATQPAIEQPAIELSKSEVSDAGQPAAELLEAVNAAALRPGESGSYGSGTDGGEPSSELMQAVQGAESPSHGAPGLYIVDGGPASNA
jgi:hypothetical protein